MFSKKWSSLLIKNCRLLIKKMANVIYTEEQLAKVPLTNFAHANAKPDDIEFYLYKTGDQTHELQLTAQTIDQIDTALPTKIITHGFETNRSSPWYPIIKSAYFALGPHNIVLIDWQKAGNLSYKESAANIQPVGGFIADLILQCKIPLQQVHLIGYSLGAHLVGFAGKEVYRRTGQKVGRITGLDPAGPGFERAAPEGRLSDSDAEFVDVVHSDIGYFGIVRPIGHVDFYVNGGREQPGCPARDVDENCSHRRAVYSFIESIAKSPEAVEGEFRDKRVEKKKGGKQAVFGDKVDRQQRGIFHVETMDCEPYFP